MDLLEVTDIRNSRSRSRTPFLRSNCDPQSCTAENHEHEVENINLSTGSDEVFISKTITKAIRKSQRNKTSAYNKILNYSSEDSQVSDGLENEQTDMSIYNNRINNSVESKISAQNSQKPVNGTKSKNKHLAHNFYKTAGDYWNKYPKTDYTYSPLSQDRREIAPGVITIPNMSRRSLHSFDENISMYNDVENTIKSRKKFQSEEYSPARRLEHLLNSKQYNTNSFIQSETIWQKILKITRISLLYATIISCCSNVWNFVTKKKSKSVPVRKEIYRHVNETKSWYLYIWEPIVSMVSSIIVFYYGIQNRILLSDIWFINTFSLHTRRKTIYLILGFLLLPILLLSALMITIQMFDTSLTAFTYLTTTVQDMLSDIYKLLSVFFLMPFSLLVNNTNSYIQTQEQVHSMNGENIYPNLDAVYSDDKITNLKFENENKISIAITPEIVTEIHRIVQKSVDEKYKYNSMNIIPEEKINEIVHLIQDQLIRNNYLKDLIFNQDMISMLVKEVNINLEKNMKLTPNLISKIIKEIHSDSKFINSDLLINSFLTSTQFSNLMLSYTENFKNNIKNDIHNMINEQNSVIADLKNDINGIKITNNDLIKKEDINSKIAQLQYLMQKQNHLNTVFNTKLQMYYDKSFNAIEPHLHKILKDLLISSDSKLKEEIFIWVQNSFVRKNDLEEKLLQLNMKPEDYKQLLSLSSVTINEQISKIIDDKLLENNEQIENFKLEHELLKNQITELSTKFLFFINEQKQALELFIKQQENEKINFLEKYKELTLTQTTIDEKFKEMEIKLNLFIQTQNNEKAKFFEMQSKSTSDFTTSAISLDKFDVEKIVQDMLAIYDADKTGQVDYALESAGGHILSTRCTENYQLQSAEISLLGIPIWHPSNSPRTVIDSGIAPGKCWSFQNFPGFLVVGLSARIYVTAFSLEHISKLLAPSGKIDSAPQNFSVWGLKEEFDPQPFNLGQYVYDADGPPLQYFIVEQVNSPPFKIIELRIESNHGHQTYTCLYRFRVHGRLAETESDNSMPP